MHKQAKEREREEVGGGGGRDRSRESKTAIVWIFWRAGYLVLAYPPSTYPSAMFYYYGIDSAVVQKRIGNSRGRLTATFEW